MPGCPRCGTENAAGSRFCNGCGTPLLEPAHIRAPEERKVVTSLFCDLVGFTASAEGADPEDVDRMLGAYFAMVRGQVESHGGVVEKFIGDAVLGVFGVPAAHEDDPERAVRAALRIVEAAEQLHGLGSAPLRLRVGINTGEALVRIGVTPDSGERFLAGDAINTAARIQTAAPDMGVAVGLATYEATKAVFDYAELEPATLKGKSEPVRIFEARSPLARIGVDLTRTHGGPYVGREIDLGLLRGLFDKSVAGTSVQLVTVVGEPGIGKSRIVAELLAHARAREPRLTWRQGRCLPYGDGVTFWALGEIVKAHAGILESDDPTTAASKINQAVPAGPDREWLCQRLLPLTGVDASSSAEREELFAAWRTFLENVAEQTPTVLVFEDIHWADDAMLAFLEHLADRAEGVPLMLVATARPELFDRHATFAAGLPNVNRINLAPLSERETSELVSGLLDASEIAPEIRTPILERAEGNPLYVEEFLRLLKDQDLLGRDGDAWVLRPGADLPVPGSIQSLIASRLDTLAPERKVLLSDAAVVGKVFWAGAVAAIGDRPVEDVIQAMRELARKELVRPARHSSMAGEAEYAFWHVLTRDVAYAQLPRASRATGHVAAAEWLEAKAGERAEDIADVLAHHYSAALELARAAGQSQRAADLEVPAFRFLTLAGEKAMNLDASNARDLLRRAVALASDRDLDSGHVRMRLAEAEELIGNSAASESLYEESIAAFLAGGDQVSADEATLQLSRVINPDDKARSEELVDELIGRLAGTPPSRLLAMAYAEKAFSGGERGRSWADDAMSMAGELHLPSTRGRALGFRGLYRGNIGDRTGIQDLRDALEISSTLFETRQTAVNFVNLAWVLTGQDPREAETVAASGIAFEQSRGIPVASSRNHAIMQWPLLRLGRWDEVLSRGAELRAMSTDTWNVGYGSGPMAAVLVRRGRPMAALNLAIGARGTEVDRFFDLARIADHRMQGRTGAALLILEATLAGEGHDEAPREIGETDVCDCAREAVALGRVDLVERAIPLIAGDMASKQLERFTLQAIAAESRGGVEEALDLYVHAASDWQSFGDPYEEAHALLGEGRCLIRLARVAEAAPPLKRAAEIFGRLQAAPALTEATYHLDLASAASS